MTLHGLAAGRLTAGLCHLTHHRKGGTKCNKGN
jgi:hypothetical protein